MVLNSILKQWVCSRRGGTLTEDDIPVNISTVFRAALFLLAAAGIAPAQSLASRVLVVYNSSFADSLEVAQHYATQRGIPTANLCAISSADALSAANYATVVRNPVRSCLNAVGPSNILYIVMSYLTPYNFVSNNNVYGVDSYLADIWDRYSVQDFHPVPTGEHGYYSESQAAGNVYVPFVSFGTYRAGAKAQLIYSVWRLDGATEEIAKGLVDKAIAAEPGAPQTGNACLDLRYGDPNTFPDQGIRSGDWDLYRAATIAATAGFPVISDQNDAEFGTAPAPLSCPDALLYTGWYSFNNYNDAFTWKAGSVGWHLDSASAGNPRSGTNWVVNALQRGITVTSGAVWEPYLEGMPRSPGVLRNLFEGANVGDAFLRNTRWIRWRMAFFGDPLYRPFPGGRAPFSTPGYGEASLRITPRLVVGGRPVQGTVQLAVAAPGGGTVVTLTSSNAALGSVPPSVTVAAGARTANFAITTSGVASRTEVTFTTGGGATLRNDISLFPLLSRITVPQASVSGGTPFQATVLLNDRAPIGGISVSIASDKPEAGVPASITIPAGAFFASFPVTVATVGAPTPVRLTATLGSASATVDFTINP